MEVCLGGFGFLGVTEPPLSLSELLGRRTPECRLAVFGSGLEVETF
jgi:hypothetical protein